MFRTICLLSIFVVLAQSRASAQDTMFGLSGTTWVQIERSDFGALLKLTYLRGIYDGLLFGRSPELASFPPDPTWETLIAELDRFYLEPANRPILVIWALPIVQLRLQGESESDVRNSTIFNRCRSAYMTLGLSPDELSTRTQDCVVAGGPAR